MIGICIFKFHTTHSSKPELLLWPCFLTGPGPPHTVVTCVGCQPDKKRLLNPTFLLRPSLVYLFFSLNIQTQF